MNSKGQQVSLGAFPPQREEAEAAQAAASAEKEEQLAAEAGEHAASANSAAAGQPHASVHFSTDGTLEDSDSDSNADASNR